MTRSYRYYSCPDLPVPTGLGWQVETTAQLAMPWGDATAHSKLSYRGVAAHEPFELWSVEHQDERNMEVIVDQQPYGKVVQVLRPTAYYHRAGGYFLVTVGKVDGASLFRRLAGATPPVLAEPGELDLVAVRKLGATTGGWFKGLRLAEVSSIGMFGSEDIVDSDEWSRYSGIGDLSAVNMRVVFRDGSAPSSVMITQERCVVTYKDMGERDNLRFVEHLNSLFDDLPTSGGQPDGDGSPSTT